MAEGRNEFKVKGALAKNALAWRAESYQTTQLHGAVASAYLAMLLAPPEDLGQAIDASPHSKVLPTVWKKTSIRFVRDVEQRLVEDAIQQGIDGTWRVWNEGLFGVFLDLVKMAIAPHIGLYVLLSGAPRKANTPTGGSAPRAALPPCSLFFPWPFLSRDTVRAARAFELQAQAEVVWPSC